MQRRIVRAIHHFDDAYDLWNIGNRNAETPRHHKYRIAGNACRETIDGTAASVRSHAVRSCRPGTHPACARAIRSRKQFAWIGTSLARRYVENLRIDPGTAWYKLLPDFCFHKMEIHMLQFVVVCAIMLVSYFETEDVVYA